MDASIDIDDDRAWVHLLLAPFAGICALGFGILSVVLCIVHTRDPTVLENDSFFTVELGVLLALCVSLQLLVFSLQRVGDPAETFSSPYGFTSSDPPSMRAAGVRGVSSAAAARLPASTVFEKGSRWRPSAFRRFQATYLAVYLMMLFADWLQGPYVFQLYSSYGYTEQESAGLFMAGFTSSLVFGFFAGSLADRYGRKRMCVACALSYALSCASKPFPVYWVLLAGRVLAGVATSLLFSVFEAWMVSEHHERGFEHSALASTFAAATLGSGVMAIVAGVVAHELSHAFGFLGPFMIAMVVLLAAAGAIWVGWTENVGEPPGTTERQVIRDSLRVVFGDRRVFLTGVVQASFEAAMFIFVFVWTPTMAHGAVRPKHLSLGLIFSVFMTCMMIGSALFRLLQRLYRVEAILTCTIAASMLSLAVPATTSHVHIVVNGFLAYELTCGVYFPAIACLRSDHVPEPVRASVINLFRVPLNVIVVVLLSDVSRLTDRSVFSLCIAILTVALLAQLALWYIAHMEDGKDGVVYARDMLRPSVMHEAIHAAAAEGNDELTGLLYDNNHNN